MNCPNCGKVTKVHGTLILIVEDDYDRWFCDRACLRAWLGPDRPLTRRLEAPPRAAFVPQHIVHVPTWWCPVHGEISVSFCKQAGCIELPDKH